MRKEELFKKAKKVKLLVFDVDGVMTDGKLYFDLQGNVTKSFHVQDGYGIKLAQKCGLEIAVITGLDNPCVAARIKQLGITEYIAGNREKFLSLQEICERKNIDMQEVAYIGDDWIDVKVLNHVGFSASVPNARKIVQEKVNFVTDASGGNGAVREFIEFILEAKDQLNKAFEEVVGA